MASKRASDVGSNDKDLLDVPSTSSTKRIKHGNQEEQQKEIQQHLLFPTTSTSTLNNNTLAFYFEPLLRKVMQEVIPPMLHRHLTPSCGLTLNELANTFGRRRLQLYFMNKLPETIFTKSIIKAEGDEPLQIELRDVENQQRIVREEGSSMKIQLCVLYGDFEKEDWTAEEFNTQIVPPREGKGQLLIGNTIITLRNGVADINKEIEFTDISKRRTGQFRLGVKIVQSNSIGACIREGRSEPFKVLDVRGKSYEKHGRPSLNDKVWRLKGIRKDGPLDKQLASDGIQTVKDFLQLYITNEASLREKLGKTGEKSWNKIIAHAQDCDVDDDGCYIYYVTEHPISSLVFNSIYKVVEVTFHNEQNSRSIQSLNLQEERMVERIKQHAYKNLNDLKPLPIDTTIHGLVETSTSAQTAQYGGQDQTSTSAQTAQYGGQDQALQQFDFPIAQQGPLNAYSTSFNIPFACQPEMWTSTSTSISQSGLVGYEFYDQMEMPPYFSVEGASQNGQFRSYALEQVNANALSYDYGDGAGSSNHSSSPKFVVNISSKVKLKKDWQKIRSALKWFMLYAAARKREQLFYDLY